MNQSAKSPTLAVLPALMFGVIWVLFLGWIDLRTGPELALSVFYLPGIAVTAWFSGRFPALGLGIFSALVWMTAETLSGTAYSQDYLPYWNGAIRLIYFETTAILISEVRSRRTGQQALGEQENLLRSILDSMNDGVVVVGIHGHIRMFNPAAKRIFQSDPLGQDMRQWLATVDPSLQNAFELAKGSPTARFDPKFRRLSECVVIPHPGASPVHLEVFTQPLSGVIRSNFGWLLVISDVTPRKEQERRIAEAGEAEQRRIGQDLHDGLGQHLVSLSFAAGMLQERLENEGQHRHSSDLAEIAAGLRDAIGQARSLARGLYPVGLEESLAIGLKGLADSTIRHSGILCSFESPENFPALPESVAIHLYRIAQECVNNALRHANASCIHLSLDLHADQFCLEIRDDGIGFEVQDGKDGIGLHILRNRARLIGAELVVQSPLGEGTRVICRVPLNLEKKIEPQIHADEHR